VKNHWTIQKALNKKLDKKELVSKIQKERAR